MLLAIGLLVLVGLWWLGRYGWRLPLRARPRRLGAYAVLALAAVLAVRGRIELAILAAALGLWLLEGRERLARVAARWDPRAALRARMGPIAWTLAAGGAPRDGRVRAGPHAGESLSRLSRGDLLALLRACRLRDAPSARLLEAYLDGRYPGWRVDADGDRDARARGPLQPGTMTQEEAYQVLGLERGATLEEVRAAHRILMKRLHPDQGGSVERAARVNAARDRLTNRHR